MTLKTVVINIKWLVYENDVVCRSVELNLSGKPSSNISHVSATLLTDADVLRFC
jgi:hypothetical protein